MRHSPFAPLMLLGVAMLAGCATDPGAGSRRTGWDEIAHVLAIDFAPRAANRRITSFRRLLDVPSSEAGRVPGLVGAVSAVPASVPQRARALLATNTAMFAAAMTRSQRLFRPERFAALPGPDRVAAAMARDLGRLGMLLGLQRRPLAESSDRRHRVNPLDDRPEMTIWQRLRRRIFP